MANRAIEFDIVGNDRATTALRGVRGAISELSDRMAKMFTATALFDRGLGMLQQGFSAFVDTLKGVADLKDAATAAGLTTDEYQRLGMAAQQAGLDQQGLMKGLKTIKEFLRDARVEGSRQAEVLRALGFSQEAVTSGSIDAMDAMDKLSGAVEAATTPQEKYNVAAAVFGARAQELIPLLDGLRTALRNVADEPIVSAETIDNLDRVEKKMTRLMNLGKVAAAQVGESLFTERGLRTLGAALFPGLPGLFAGQAASDYVNAPGKPNLPVTAEGKAAAAALGKLGMTATAGGSSSGLSGISSAQALGMATSIALAQQQTAYLATIAANTSPAMGGAMPGQTNITRPADATQQEVDVLARKIRFAKSVPIFPHTRPAR